MWLLDANMDVHLVQTLNELGVACDTAANRGWKAFSNGELVAAAVSAGFTCLLTRDQLFGESAARALKTFPQLCRRRCGPAPATLAGTSRTVRCGMGRKVHRTGCRYPGSLAPEVTDYFPGTNLYRGVARTQTARASSAHDGTDRNEGEIEFPGLFRNGVNNDSANAGSGGNTPIRFRLPC
jgi:hypothetical protein